MKNISAKILFYVPAGFALDLCRFYLYFVVVYLGYKMGPYLRVLIGENVWHVKGV